jgi:hypothetical protein
VKFIGQDTFQVLAAACVKMIILWDVVLCSLVALMMEAVSTSETSENFYQITQRRIPEDSQLLLGRSFLLNE